MLQDGYVPSKTSADGYVFNPPENDVLYPLQTQWIDLHSAEFCSVSVVLSPGMGAGSIQLRQSNDRQSQRSGNVFPMSALSCNGQPIDAAYVPQNIQATNQGTGPSAVATSGAGVYVLNQVSLPYRWLQVIINASKQGVVPGSSTYGILAATTITNDGYSVITGDLGLYPGTSVTGFPPGTVTGTSNITNTAAANAQIAANAVFVEGNALLGGITMAGDIGGSTLTPGVYKSASSLGITGTLILDGQGNPNASWVFQIGSTLTTATSAIVELVNGAQPANVLWLVGSSATLGTGTTFVGNIIAEDSITLVTGASVLGSLAALTAAVTLGDNAVTVSHTTSPVPVGGPTLSVLVHWKKS